MLDIIVFRDGTCKTEFTDCLSKLELKVILTQRAATS